MLAGSLCAPAVLSAQLPHTIPTHADMATSDSTAVHSLLTNPLGSRGPSGVAVLSGRTLRIEWTGDQAGSTRPWALRQGSCTSDEGALNATAALTPLMVDASGNARASAELEAPVSPGKIYLVVHNSSADPERVVLACGSLPNGAAGETSNASMDHSTIDHSAMDHSAMTMTSSKSDVEHQHADTSGTGTTGSSHDSRSAGLMVIYARMMADPVIRERVRTDPALQRMIDDIDMDAANMRMSDAIVAPNPPAAKSPEKKAAKKAATSQPSAKQTPKPAATSMPGMDHSKMPGMKKPPV